MSTSLADWKGVPAPTVPLLEGRFIRLEKLDNAEAWHWASCDAGVGRIGRFAREQVKKTSQPQAEKFGIENVQWRRSDALSQA